jgi:transcriptional regulator with XRE-family HTH domain
MLVKDQIRIRMEQLKISVAELASRLGVSNQTVRHWLSGRSFPGKSKTPDLERALSFKLDYSEGASNNVPTVESSLQATDVETFLAISRLPPEIKHLFGKLATAVMHHLESDRAAFVELNSGPVVGRRHSVPRR